MGVGDREFGVYPLDDVVGDEVFDVPLVEARIDQDRIPLLQRLKILLPVPLMPKTFPL